eukprot:symbB.v1.2.036856.t1/scaffold5303.1/size28582/1
MSEKLSIGNKNHGSCVNNDTGYSYRFKHETQCCLGHLGQGCDETLPILFKTLSSDDVNLPGSNVVIHWNVCNCGWLELIMHGEELRFDEICSFCFRPHDAHAPPPPSGLPPPRPPGHGQDRHRFPSKVRSLSEGPADGRTSRELGEEEEGSSAKPGGHNILVAVRCRALLPQERHAIITICNGTTVILEDPHTTAADDYLRLNKSKERRYHFDQALEETAQNLEVYERTTRFLIPSVIQGFNATVFAYGATSAGKTHTMLGYPGEPGIMLLTLRDLFSEVANQKSSLHFEIKCSFLEVYNENVRDLLRPDSDFLDIREDPVKGMCVAGISEVGGLESAEEIMALLHQGNKNRTTEATGANVTSSRSHAVLQVMVHQRDRTADIVAHVNLGKLSMIDLAGPSQALFASGVIPLSAARL